MELAEKTAAHQIEFEELRANIAAQAAEHDARRDYEYEARKRLYTECEPLFFQLGESVRSVVSRVSRIAEASRHGHLAPGPGGWLSGAGYFMLSTMYRMIRPLVYARLLQEVLTTVDLTLDPVVAYRYRLAQILYETLTGDFGLAETTPALPYDPNNRDAAALADRNPAKYRRQGLYSGILDMPVEALTKREPSTRSISFGEFAAASRIEGGPVREAFGPVFNLVHNFDPAMQPVLWRILITQALLSHQFLQIQQAKPNAEPGWTGGPRALPMELDPSSFDWRTHPGVASDEAVLVTPFEAGRRYIEKHTYL